MHCETTCVTIMDFRKHRIRKNSVKYRTSRQVFLCLSPVLKMFMEDRFEVVVVRIITIVFLIFIDDISYNLKSDIVALGFSWKLNVNLLDRCHFICHYVTWSHPNIHNGGNLLKCGIATSENVILCFCKKIFTSLGFMSWDKVQLSVFVHFLNLRWKQAFKSSFCLKSSLTQIPLYVIVENIWS